MPQPSYTDMLAVTDDFTKVQGGVQRAVMRGFKIAGGALLHTDVDEETGDTMVTVRLFPEGDLGVRDRTYRLTFTEETA